MRLHRNIQHEDNTPESHTETLKSKLRNIKLIHLLPKSKTKYGKFLLKCWIHHCSCRWGKESVIYNSRRWHYKIISPVNNSLSSSSSSSSMHIHHQCIFVVVGIQVRRKGGSDQKRRTSFIDLTLLLKFVQGGGMSNIWLIWANVRDGPVRGNTMLRNKLFQSFLLVANVSSLQMLGKNYPKKLPVSKETTQHCFQKCGLVISHTHG